MRYGWLSGILAALLGFLAARWRRYLLSRPPQELDDFSTLPAVTHDYTVPESQDGPVSPKTASDSTLTPKPMPTTPEPAQSNTEPKDTLILFCEAIRDMEGAPGDASYRNNNPGNFRCSPVGYAAKYGKVKCSPGGFAVFPTYDLGWLYLQNNVWQRYQKHPDWTIFDFFQGYAPKADGNDPVKYAAFVAKHCGVSPSTSLRVLFH